MGTRNDEVPLRERCNGKWRSLLPEMGVSSNYLNGKHGPCPICESGTDRFRFDDKDGDGRWICGVCGAGDGFDLLMKIKKWTFHACAQELERIVDDAKVEHVKRSELGEAAIKKSMNQIWRMGVPIHNGDEVQTYLAARGIEKYDWPALRIIPQFKFPDGILAHGRTCACMLAKVFDKDGKPVQIHRTFISGGAKAEMVEGEPNRKMMPGKIPKGSAIRLGQPGKVMGIAEGIETALAAAQLFNHPVWAVISTSMMMAWEPPDGIEQLVIYGDNDPKFAGQSAAYSLGYKLAHSRRQDLKVAVEIPELPGDWNDVLKEREG